MRQAVRDAGVPLQMVWAIQYSADGRLIQAKFDVRAGLYDRFSYLYDPESGMDKSPNPDTIVIKQINDAWWFLSEDWN